MISRRRFLTLGASALGVAAAGGVYAWQIEPFWVDLVRRPMPLADLPESLVGTTLLQVSDIHVGPRVSSDYLIHSLTAAQALEPDFVAFTGDFVSFRSAHEVAELARVLRSMPRGRLGTVASLGNHDYGRNWRDISVADDVSRVATDAGMVMLRNDVRTIGGLQFAGLADFWSPEFGTGHGEPPTGALLAPASPFAPARTDAARHSDGSRRDSQRSSCPTIRTRRISRSGRACTAGCSPDTRMADRCARRFYLPPCFP